MLDLHKFFIMHKGKKKVNNLIDHSPMGFFRANLNEQTNIVNKHNRVKIPNWQEAYQLAIYKRSRRVELGIPRTTPASRQNEIWTRDLRISLKSNALTTRPRCLQKTHKMFGKSIDKPFPFCLWNLNNLLVVSGMHSLWNLRISVENCWWKSTSDKTAFE